jgi:CheY-like chemotaxis protein
MAVRLLETEAEDVLQLSQQQEDSNGKNRRKVLVVDDDDAIRTMVERVLRRNHYDVESARDGCEAIEKLTRNDYSTILLDLMMPRIDGHGVLRFLENEHGEPAPPVIVMTANIPDVPDTAEAKSVFRVLPKPFDISQLLAHVRDSVTPVGAMSDE